VPSELGRRGQRCGVVPWWHPPPTRSLRLPGILCEKLLTYLRGSWRPERDRASATRARPSGPPRAWPDRERGSSARSGCQWGGQATVQKLAVFGKRLAERVQSERRATTALGRACVSAGSVCWFETRPPSLSLSVFCLSRTCTCGAVSCGALVVWCRGGIPLQRVACGFRASCVRSY
jgi:hypothetical protein